MKTRWRSAALFAAALAACSARDDGGLPPVFAHKSLAEARAAVRGTDRILVVKATASWCVPCKKMDRTTWRDPRVEGWFRDHGLVIALDVDAAADDAKALRIEAMPTMVAFRADREVDRITGYRDAEQLLEWLGGVAKGESRAAKLVERAHGVADGSLKLSCSERYDLARDLAAAGHPDEALELFARLWATMLDEEPAMVGVRSSFMVGEMERLAERHAPAKARFTAMRDALEDGFADPVTAKARKDWVLLNKVVGDEEKTLSWLDGALDEPKSRALLDELGLQLEELLIERDRWVELGRLLRDPRRRIGMANMLADMTAKFEVPGGADMQKEMAETHAMLQRRTYGTVYAAMIAAGRDADAEWVRANAIGREDSAAMRAALDEFVERARRARAATPRPR